MTATADITDIGRMIEAVNRVDFAYHDTSHVYMLDGQRCRSITNVAKIPTDDYMVNQWRHRMAALGFVLDPTLLEDIAAHRDDNGRINDIVQKAIDLAGANRGAQRGTQAHAATEYSDLDQPLLTPQQLRDSDVWRRTLDAYKIVVVEQFIERVVLYPDDLIAGRIDRYVHIGSDDLVDMDIKTGSSAVRYPHATAVQLGLHVSAPLIQTDRVFRDGFETTSAWRAQPEGLRRDVAYVLSMPTRDEVDLGTLYEFTLAGRYAGEVAARAAVFCRHFQMNSNLCRSIAAPRRLASETNGKMLPTEPPEGSNVLDIGQARSLVEARAREQGELRGRIAMLAEAPKMLLRMAWDVNILGSLTDEMTLEQIGMANDLVDKFDAFATVAPISESIERHPSNHTPVPRWVVEEGDDPPPPDIVDRLMKVYVEMPDTPRKLVDDWSLDATTHGCTFHGAQITRRRFHLLTGAMHLAMNDAGEMVRLIVATVADDDWPHDERLSIGAVIGLLHADQSEAFATLALDFLGGGYHVDESGRRLERNES